MSTIFLAFTLTSLGACSSSSAVSDRRGSGGSTASGGSAGTTSGGGSPGGTSSGGMSGGTSTGGSANGGNANGGTGNSGFDCANFPLCDDFEAAAPGGPPDAAKWSLSTPDCSGAGTLSIDGDVAHSGSHSLRVDGKGNYCDHVFVGNQSAVGAIGKLLYGRLFVRFGAALDASHTTFMAFNDSGDNADLRMGAQNAALKWNRESNDASLPRQSPTGIATSIDPTTNEWHCMAFMLDQNNGHISTQIDGVAVAGLQNDGVSTPDIDDEWLTSPWIFTLTDVRLGWEAYGGQAMTIWFDDVAFASTPIACN